MAAKNQRIYFSASNDKLVLKPYWVPAAFILFFSFASILFNPFYYGQRISYSSGLYFVPVLKTWEPQLFPVDEFIPALSKFTTVFYTVLGETGNILKLPAENLEPVLQWMYWCSRITLILVVFSIAKLSGQMGWGLWLLGVWASLPQSAILSVTGVIPTQAMDHNWPAFLLGLMAVIMLLQRRWLGFFGFLAGSVLVQPLLGLHLAICTIPPVFILERKSWKALLPGLLLFIVSLLFYAVFLSPPSVSSDAAEFLIRMERRYANVVPFGNQSTLSFLNLLATTGAAVFLHRRFHPSSWINKVLIWTVLSGVILGLGLSTATYLVTKDTWLTIIPMDIPYRLVQLQPARIFVWVTLLFDLFFLANGSALMREKPLMAYTFLAWFSFRLLGSAWAIIFMGYILLWLMADFVKHFPAQQTNHLARFGLILLTCGVILGWFFHALLPFESFGFAIGLIPAICLLLLAVSKGFEFKVIKILLVGMIIAPLLFVPWDQEQRQQERIDTDWNQIRIWVRENTPVDSRFLLVWENPKESLPHFRNIALRTPINEMSGSLHWVDPLAYQENEWIYNEINSANANGVWDSSELLSLAVKYDADYFLVHDVDLPLGEPAYTQGSYKLFAVP